MKVALVHDYLREYGGAERVVEALHEIFPEAPLYTAFVNLKSLGFHGERLKGWDIRTSWLQKLPGAERLISPLRILAPKIFESFNFSEYDLVISSCNVYFSKAVKVRPGALHISYIHTPPRYLYGYATSFNYKKNPITRILGELANHFLRISDFETSQRPDVLVANSKNVAERIRKFYRREPVVIYPPVNINKFAVRSSEFGVEDKKYFLSVSRLVRGKGVEIIIEACGRLGLPLKVVGTGPLLRVFKAQFSNFKNVEFLGSVEDEKMGDIYGGAKATIVASEDEDFGIVPVESLASGTPVITLRAGGFLETVAEGRTGVFFDQATPESLMAVLQNFDLEKYDPEDCRKQSEKFSKEQFKEKILELINQKL